MKEQQRHALNFSAAYKRYFLIVLMLVFASNALDRVAFGILLQSIKVDLSLSDTQIGLMTGLAFALFYSLMGIPIARWSDRGNRITIISLTTALWSVAVALCGLATSFMQLLLIRVGVAIGEAGCLPPAHSLIADHFSRLERPKAVATYMLGPPLATVLGFFGAGWLNELYGWRTTLVILGLPGVVLAALVFFTLKEPRRYRSAQSVVADVAADAEKGPETAPQQPANWVNVFSSLWSIKSFRHLLAFFAIASFFTTGVAQWKPAFFIRSFGMETGELGTWLAITYGIGGFLGTYLGGAWVSRFAAGDEGLQLRAIAILQCGLGIASAGIYLSSTAELAFILLTLTMFASGMVAAPLFATIHALVPDRMRATAIAILYLAANLIGLGLGPIAAGIMSDAFYSWAKEESLRYTLLALCPGYLWCALHLWRASRLVASDLLQPATGNQPIRVAVD